MTTDLMSNSHIRPLATLPQNQTYYRSRVFTAESGVNELVIAAQPLLVLISRIIQANTEPQLEQFSEHVIHELKTFESRAEQFRYDAKTLFLGRYFLVTAIEAAISHRSWYPAWQASNPLQEYLQEGHSPQQVSIVLDRLFQHPHQHLDALELAYLCFSLADSQDEWQPTLDSLFQRIRALRGEINPRLFFSRPAFATLPRNSQWSWWMTGLICSGFLGSCFALYTYLIGSV